MVAPPRRAGISPATPIPIVCRRWTPITSFTTWTHSAAISRKRTKRDDENGRPLTSNPAKQERPPNSRAFFFDGVPYVGRILKGQKACRSAGHAADQVRI